VEVWWEGDNARGLRPPKGSFAKNSASLSVLQAQINPYHLCNKEVSALLRRRG
jgi:hypothetical protein